MNNSNDKWERMEKLGIFCYKILALPVSDIVLFEKGLGLIINAH